MIYDNLLMHAEYCSFSNLTRLAGHSVYASPATAIISLLGVFTQPSRIIPGKWSVKQWIAGGSTEMVGPLVYFS